MNFNPVTKKWTYSKADETLCENFRRLASAIADYESGETKIAATSAFNNAQHCLTHIQKQRGK